MGDILDLKLDLLRSGPAHNQLVSPLTPYLALCGAEGPVTVRLPFEHAQLLARLERLRYATDGVPVAAAQREAEVRDLGEAIGQILREVPGLLAEVSRARGEQGDLVHLRLSMTAYELALVPFELAIAPEGFPERGAPLFLQPVSPISLTREVRRGRPLPVQWNRPFRILFAFAAPEGLPPVPAQRHLEALRRAIEPWTKWEEDPEKRIAEVTKHLTVLPKASLQQIRRACAEGNYTHVHILAHGERNEKSGRYGLSLCGSSDSTAKDFVEGDVLARALTTRDVTGRTRSTPTVVSLATCDSGNPGSVVTAGGSLAHALHAGNIPWVFASQFPLWMRASSIAADVLYTGLLRGDDPRWVLHDLRQRLRVDSPTTHDWASIVAYAELPGDFPRQIEAFRNWQIRQKIEVKFDKAEKFAKDKKPKKDQEAIYEDIRRDLEHWYCTLPPDAPLAERAERLGMRAASEKRIGVLIGDPKEATQSYENAREYYDRALNADPANHWVLTQYLSMMAVLGGNDAARRLASDFGSWWTAARQLASWQLRKATGVPRAWALGTLAELELLGAIYARDFDPSRARDAIVDLCEELCRLVGKDAFPVSSTRRQFLRYLDPWESDSWTDLAKAAVAVLPEGASWSARAHPGPDADPSP